MPWLNLEEDLAEEFDSFAETITYKEREGFSVRGNFFVSDEERVARRELKRREAYADWCANYVPSVSPLTRPKAETIQESEASRAWREARAKKPTPPKAQPSRPLAELRTLAIAAAKKKHPWRWPSKRKRSQ